jgi:hypothetical protein
VGSWHRDRLARVVRYGPSVELIFLLTRTSSAAKDFICASGRFKFREQHLLWTSGILIILSCGTTPEERRPSSHRVVQPSAIPSQLPKTPACLPVHTSMSLCRYDRYDTFASRKAWPRHSRAAASDLSSTIAQILVVATITQRSRTPGATQLHDAGFYSIRGIALTSSARTWFRGISSISCKRTSRTRGACCTKSASCGLIRYASIRRTTLSEVRRSA